MVGPLALLIAAATSAASRERTRELQQRLGATPRTVDREAWIRSQLSARQMALFQGLTGEDLRPWANVATLLVMRIRSLPRLPSLEAVGPDGWLREEAMQIRDWQTATQADALRLGWTEALAESRAWHEALEAEANPAPLQVGQNTVVWRGGAWVAVAIDTAAKVQAEGNALSHCVATGGYWSRVKSGEIELYGLRAAQNIDTPVLTLEVERLTGRLLQARGRVNRMPTAREQMEAVDPFLADLRRQRAAGKGGLDHQLAQFTILGSRDTQGVWGPPDNELGVHLYAVQTSEQIRLLQKSDVQIALDISPVDRTLQRVLEATPGAAVIAMTGKRHTHVVLGPQGMDLGLHVRRKGLPLVAGPQWGLEDKRWWSWDLFRPLLEALVALGKITRRPEGVGGEDTVVHPFDHPIDASHFVMEDWASPLLVERMGPGVPLPELPTWATVVARPISDVRRLTHFEVGLWTFAEVARRELQEAPGPEWRFPAADEVWARVQKAQGKRTWLSMDDVRVFLDAMVAASDACASMRVPRAWATVRLAMDPGNRKPGLELIWARDRLAVRVGRIRRLNELPGRWVTAVIAPTPARALSAEEQAEVKRRMARVPAWTPSKALGTLQWTPKDEDRQSFIPPVAILQQQPVEEVLPELGHRCAVLGDAPAAVSARWMEAMASVQQAVWDTTLRAGLPDGSQGPGFALEAPQDRRGNAIYLLRRRLFVDRTEWRIDPSEPLKLAWWAWVPTQTKLEPIALPGEDRNGNGSQAQEKDGFPMGAMAEGRLVRLEVDLAASHPIAQRFRKAFGTLTTPPFEPATLENQPRVSLPGGEHGMEASPFLQVFEGTLGVLPWQDGWAILAAPEGITKRITSPPPASGLSWDGRAWRAGPPVALPADALAANLAAAAATPLPTPAPTPAPAPARTGTAPASDRTLVAQLDAMRSAQDLWFFALPPEGTEGGGARGARTRFWMRHGVMVNGRLEISGADVMEWLDLGDHWSFVNGYATGEVSLHDVDLTGAVITTLGTYSNPIVMPEQRQETLDFFLVRQPQPGSPGGPNRPVDRGLHRVSLRGRTLTFRSVGVWREEPDPVKIDAVLSLSEDRHVRVQISLPGQRNHPNPEPGEYRAEAWMDDDDRVVLHAVWSDPDWKPVPAERVAWAVLPVEVFEGASVFFTADEAMAAPREDILIGPNDLAWNMPVEDAQKLLWRLLGPAWAHPDGWGSLVFNGLMGQVRLLSVEGAAGHRITIQQGGAATPLPGVFSTERSAHLEALRWTLARALEAQQAAGRAFIEQVERVNRIRLTPWEADRLVSDVIHSTVPRGLLETVQFTRQDGTPLRITLRGVDQPPSLVQGGLLVPPLPPVDRLTPWGARLATRALVPPSATTLDPEALLAKVRREDLVIRMSINSVHLEDLEYAWEGTLVEPMNLRDLVDAPLENEVEFDAFFPDLGMRVLLTLDDMRGVLAHPFIDGTKIVDMDDVSVELIRYPDREDPDRPLDFVLRVPAANRRLPDVVETEEVAAPAGEEGNRILVVDEMPDPEETKEYVGLAFVRPDGKDAYVAMTLEAGLWDRAQAWLIRGSEWEGMSGLDWRTTPRKYILALRPSLFPDMDTAMAALKVANPDSLIGPNELPLLDMTTPLQRANWSQPMWVAWLLSVVWLSVDKRHRADGSPFIEARQFDGTELRIEATDDVPLRVAYRNALRDTIAWWLDSPLVEQGRMDSLPMDVFDELPHLRNGGRGRDLFPRLRAEDVIPLAELFVPPARRCPGCGQVIVWDQGFGECGGAGEGICAEAVYAFDAQDNPQAALRTWQEWTDPGDGNPPPPPPDDALVAQIRAAFEPPEDIVCPGCHHVITIPEEGGTAWGECGGHGNGLCPAAEYAIDVVEAPQAALAQWRRVVANRPPPDGALADRIREAFRHRGPQR